MAKHRIDDKGLHEAVEGLVATIDELFGLYLDCSAGFKRNARDIAQAQQVAARDVPPGTNQDELAISFGRGAPTDPKNVVLHTTTQGEYKQRNVEGGRNHVRMAQLLIVLIYEYWEHEYRTRIAKALGRDSRDEIRIPLFGDLRLLRNDILHRRGQIAGDTSRRLQVLELRSDDGALELNADHVESLVRALKAALDEIVFDATGDDPTHRRIWHVQ